MKKLCTFTLFLLWISLPLCGGDLSWENHKQNIKQELAQIPGWCSQEKAEKLMDFIYEVKPKKCVEIGAFGGSTTYPIASTLRFVGQGHLYAIDAWDNQAAIEGADPNDPNTKWWAGLDLGAIHNEFYSLIVRKKLISYCSPVYKRSDQAAFLFPNDSLDLLYLDGNFSSQGSLHDAVLYFPKVKKGGYIWLNDADCDTKNKAVAFLMKNCTWLKKKSLSNRCIVFQK